MAVIFDIIALASHTAEWSTVAYYMIGAGVLSGLLAAIFGLVDWSGIPSGTRAKSIGLWHGGGTRKGRPDFIWFEVSIDQPFGVSCRLSDKARKRSATHDLSCISIVSGGGWLIATQ